MVEANDIEVMYRNGDVILGRRAGRICLARPGADGELEVEEYSDLIRAFQVYARLAHPEMLEGEQVAVERPGEPIGLCWKLRKPDGEEVWIQSLRHGPHHREVMVTSKSPGGEHHSTLREVCSISKAAAVCERSRRKFLEEGYEMYAKEVVE